MSDILDEKNHGIAPNKYNPHAWILGDVTIGDDVWIGAFTLLDGKHAKLTIGRGCNISSGAQILTHSTVRRCVSERKYNKVDANPVKIGEYCFIGTNAVILMGAKVGHHSVVGAGAVVPEGMEVTPYSILAGVPAKIIGSSKKYLKETE